MQQLRREFSKARVLLQLVLERERLNAASADIAGELFAQAIYELTPSSASSSLFSITNNGSAHNKSSSNMCCFEEESLKLSSAPGTAAIVLKRRRQEIPYRHALTFEHLLRQVTSLSTALISFNRAL